MKRTIFTSAAMFLFISALIFYKSEVFAGSKNYTDIKIYKMQAEESIQSTGEPAIHVAAIIQNKGDLAAENCEIKLLMNGKEVDKKTYVSIETDYNYLFSGQYPTTVQDGYNELTISACPANASEKRSSDNEMDRKIKVTSHKSTLELAKGTDVDLKINEYKVISVRDEQNINRQWQYIQYKNTGYNASDKFSIRYLINGGGGADLVAREGIIQSLELPGNSPNIYSGYFSKNPFLEGKNLVNIMLDNEDKIAEKDEKNSYYYLVNLSDGSVNSIVRSNDSQTIIVDNLLYVPQVALEDDVQFEIDGPGVLALSMINVGENIAPKDLDGNGTQDARVLTIQLRQSNTIYEQKINIADWKTGIKKPIFLTEFDFKKKELTKPFAVTVYLDGKKLHSRTYRVSCY